MRCPSTARIVSWILQSDSSILRLCQGCGQIYGRSTCNVLEVLVLASMNTLVRTYYINILYYNIDIIIHELVHYCATRLLS